MAAGGKAKNYRIVPRAVDWIEALLQKHRLEPTPATYRPALATKQRARFYMTRVRYRHGSAWFKATLKSEPRLLAGLRDEISTQRAFADYERRARPSFYSPSWLDSRIERDRAWLLRKFWVGDYAGEMYSALGFSTGFVRSIKPEQMARVIRDIGKMSTFMRGRLKIPTHDHDWYRLDYQYYRRKILPGFLNSHLNPGWTTGDLLAWEKRLHQHWAFLKRRTRVFTHGDLYPNNVMVDKHGARPRVVVFDWELANWNVASFDAVLVWLLAWRHPAWQQRFRRAVQRHLPGGTIGRREWAIAQFSLSVRLLAYAWIRLNNLRPEQFPKTTRRHRPLIRRMATAMTKAVRQSVSSL